LKFFYLGHVKKPLYNTIQYLTVLLHHIGNPTKSIDERLLEERPCQISFLSKLK